MTLSQFLDTFSGDIGRRLKNLGRIGHCRTSSTSGCQLYIEVRPSVGLQLTALLSSHFRSNTTSQLIDTSTRTIIAQMTAQLTIFPI